MKKIITMVGTSIFERYFEDNGDRYIRNYYEDLIEKRAKEYESQKARVEVIRRAFRRWFEERQDNRENFSAEIKSLVKIRKELNDDLEVYLLCSDTVLSKLASELIKEVLQSLGFDIERVHTSLISGLQVWDREEFNNGMINLIKELYEIAGEYWDNVIINITGGYKATVPYLTILAQMNRCLIYYIFERTDALIKIPYVPLDIKWEIFEKYEEFFARLDREKVSELKGIDGEDYSDVLSLLEQVDDLCSLNPLGIVLWNRYKRRFKLFYVSELFAEYISKDLNFKSIAERCLLELKRRIEQNPKDPDLDHKLSDVNLQGFLCFKHRENDLPVRILYKVQEIKTSYGVVEYDIYAGIIRIGSDVHNVESEYIKDFENNLPKIKDTARYKLYKIQVES